MTISYLVRYLWKKKWLILVPTFIAVALAWFLTREMTPGYTSSAELSTGYMEADVFGNSRNVNTRALFNNVIQTLQSNQVLDQVSYKLLFHDLSGNVPFCQIEDKEKQQNILNKFPGGKEAVLNFLSHKIDSFYVLNLAIKKDRTIRELADLYQYAPDALLSKMQVQRIEGSDFIRVTATTSNPQLSAFVSNEVCDRFLALYQSRHGSSTTTSIEGLKNLVETKKKIYDSKLSQLQEANNASADNPDQMLAALRTQLIQQKNNLISAKATLKSVNDQISKADKKGGLADNEEIIALRNNIDQLYAKYVNGGSEDNGLLSQIAGLRAELQQKLSAVSGGASGVSLGDLQRQKIDWQTKVSVANQTINDLQENIHTLENTAQSSAARQGIIQGMQSEIEVARQQYMDANNLYNQALNRNRFPGNHFQQVLQASPPMYPDPSKKIKIIGFAGAGVFFALIFLFLFFEFVDSSIKTPAYLREHIPFPLLANLKRIQLKSPPVEEIFSINGALPNYKRGFREQVKQLRYAVENSGKKMFLITGYHPGSGKTTVVQSLAGSLSLKNKKVLLIDANFQNNTLSQKYNAEPVLESLEVKPDDRNAMKLIKNKAVAAGNDHIELLGCGSGDHTPDEVLHEHNILAWLKKNDFDFDYVLVDCASLSKGPDCKELLKYIETVIMVFAADQPLTEEEQKFMEFLKEQRINTVGAVLNKVNSYSLEA